MVVDFNALGISKVVGSECAIGRRASVNIGALRILRQRHPPRREPKKTKAEKTKAELREVLAKAVRKYRAARAEAAAESQERSRLGQQHLDFR
jgi:hypothetical protein